VSAKAEGASSGRDYHHGDLRRALLDAVADLVAEGGPDAVTLRAAARRAGVSHAAPAHHFGDLSGLLTAFAAEGFAEMDATMAREQAKADPSPGAQLLATGRGYIRFALEHPSAFRVMFKSGRLNRNDPDFCAVADRPYERLQAGLAARRGTAPPGPREPTKASEQADGRALLAWSAVHGFAVLCADGVLPRERADQMMDAMFARLGPALA
jgi:AcrR family transcriptional regulator